MGDVGLLWQHGCRVVFAGAKILPVDYDVKRVIGYIGLGVGLYFAHGKLLMTINWQPWLLASALMTLYILVAALSRVVK